MGTRLFAAFFIAVFPYIFPLQLRNTLDVLFHSLRAGLLHFLGDVSVDIQSEGGGVMAHVRLDGFHVVTSPERCHGEAVTKVVQPCVRQADGGYDSFIVVVDGAGGQMLADLVAEYVAIILPERTSLQPDFDLPGLVPLQQLYYKRRY